MDEPTPWVWLLPVTATEKGARTARQGHVLSVFRKSPSGKWLLARDANLIQAGQHG
jgi:ketosteroid isomerase-like protein